jgi:glycosyltransferase involved in cell wall biosynthesis
LRIGILTASLPSASTGGAEVQATKLAMFLSRNHEVTVFTRSEPDLGRHSDVDEACFEICRRSSVSAPALRFVADIAGSMATLGRRRARLDVLLAYQSVIDGLLGVLARMLYGIPVLVSVRSEREYRFERSRLIRLLSPFVFEHANRIAVQTPTIERELLDSLRSAGLSRLSDTVQTKLAIIPNGISLRDAPSCRGRALLYVGRLIEEKGVVHLVEAMRECPNDELFIVGDGPELDRLRSCAEGLDNVHFEGRAPRDRLDDYFSRARVLVVPSVRDEGMPNVIMEAMSRGLPVIATRNAGTPDLIKDGETGLLVEPGDARAIARAIGRLAADGGLEQRIADNAFLEVRRYDWPSVVATVEQELQGLVDSRSRSLGDR